MSKIARIVSDNARFARMLSISLNSLGFTVLDKSFEADESDVSYIIADLDSVNEAELLKYSQSAVLVGFSSKSESEIYEKAALCEEFFQRPFLMRDFLSIFGGAKRVIIDRSYQRKESPKKPNYLTVSELDNAAIWGDRIIPLSDNEYKVLSLLCENRREVVERERIYAELGAEDGNMGDVYICHLRKKIDNKLGLKLIYTIRGKGYMLKN